MLNFVLFPKCFTSQWKEDFGETLGQLVESYLLGFFQVDY